MGMLEIRDALTMINFVFVAFMTIFFAYQSLFIVIGFIAKRTKKEDQTKDVEYKRYAALISARNEEGVIAQLIASLKAQDYPSDLFDIYVIADNCTDSTAKVAKEAGAYVIIRNDQVHKGKGYALDHAFRMIRKYVGSAYYEGYFVFDADNIVDKDFVKEMNRTHLLKGYEAMTSYRNSKNYDTNWISAANSLYFMKEARFLNYPRSLLNTNCAISGTGFFVSQKVITKNNGWPYHLLTEDIEFSVKCAIDGVKIGYCDKAIVYDEQPTTMKQSWDQRMRWSKGFYQINAKYTSSLIKGIFDKRSFACYDLLASTAPMTILQVIMIIINLFVYIYCGTKYDTYFVVQTMNLCETFIFSYFINMFLLNLFVGAATLVSEWDNIHTTTINKIKYLPGFVIFVMSYVPIGLVALFKKVEWKQIKHFAAEDALAFQGRKG